MSSAEGDTAMDDKDKMLPALLPPLKGRIFSEEECFAIEKRIANWSAHNVYSEQDQYIIRNTPDGVPAYYVTQPYDPEYPDHAYDADRFDSVMEAQGVIGALQLSYPDTKFTIEPYGGPEMQNLLFTVKALRTVAGRLNE